MKFIKNNCLLCEKKTQIKDVYPRNLPKNIDQVDYSGRKIPDNFHYKMVRCLECGLLFANEMYDNETIKIPFYQIAIDQFWKINKFIFEK